jgi:hypothetical protein
MNAQEWIAGYAQRLGAEPPTPAQFSAILELAAEAAHASERVAAPVACWVTAQAGCPLDDALSAARSVAPPAGSGAGAEDAG